MNRNKKIVVGIIAAILFFSVAFFIFLFVQYEPPIQKNSNAAEKGNDSVQDVLTSDSVYYPEKEDMADSDLNDYKSDNKEEFSNVIIEVRDGSGNKLTGIDCTLSANSIDNTKMENLFSRQSNQNGECYFYDLDPTRIYNVLVYWTKDRSIASQSNLGRLESGKTRRELVVRPEGVSVTPVSGYNTVSPPNNPSAPECYDPDGSNAFNKGALNYKGQIYKDSCMPSGTAVAEQVCSTSSTGSLMQISQIIDCPEKCSDGACVR